MKKILTMVMTMAIAISAAAMPYNTARNEALFLSDKMAYELGLTTTQYEAVYEINLDYLLNIDTRADVFGFWWEVRNRDLRYVLSTWQYDRFIASEWFYRPVIWATSGWTFSIYTRYGAGRMYFDRPAVYVTFRGGHSHRGGSFYSGHHFDKPNPPRGHGNHNGNHNNYGNHNGNHNNNHNGNGNWSHNGNHNNGNPNGNGNHNNNNNGNWSHNGNHNNGNYNGNHNNGNHNGNGNHNNNNNGNWNHNGNHNNGNYNGNHNNGNHNGNGNHNNNSSVNNGNRHMTGNGNNSSVGGGFSNSHRSGSANTPSRSFGRPSGSVASNGGNAPKGTFGGARR